jgi:predicted metal-binding protein
MVEKETLETLFKGHGFDDFKWINTRDIVVAQWVRFRCLFGCPNYGKKGTCPPNVPSIDECRQMISEYSQAAIFHFEKAVEKPADYKPWSKDTVSNLVKLEREVFLSGYYKTLLIPFEACSFCDDCTAIRTQCKNPRVARPGADAMGIDVYATVRAIGYHIQVLKNYKETMNRYAFLLIE